MSATAVGIALVALITIYGSVALSAQMLDGEALYKEHNCAICHGAEGRSPTRDGYPAIFGQNSTYLANQILDIRDGIRVNGKSKLMRPLVKALTQEEIDAIAIYLSGLR